MAASSLKKTPRFDVGNNVANLNDDQCGPALVNGVMSYPRVDHGTADIGAYEVQQGDIIFDNNFQTCPPLTS